MSTLMEKFLGNESTFQFLERLLLPDERMELIRLNDDPDSKRALSIIMTPEETLMHPHEILERAFVWDLTPQGHEYWSQVAKRLGG